MTDPTLVAFKRYWQPSLMQTISLSLATGTIATGISYPIEYIKTIIQHRSEAIGIRGKRLTHMGYNPFRVLREMTSLGRGITQLYGGFEANLVGRLGYLAIRNSTYKILYDKIKPIKPHNDLTSREKMWLAGFCGGIAAYITSPLTLISIRQILDSQVKLQWRRNYNTFTEVLSSLKSQKWQGSTCNVIRHVLLNISLTGPYDFIHEGLYTRFGEYDFVTPLSLFLATFFSSVVTMPADTLRTRLMQQFQQPQRNRLNYAGILDALKKSMLYEGSPYALWSGFTAYFCQMLIYAGLTVGMTQMVTQSWKRKQGLKQWQI